MIKLRYVLRDGEKVLQRLNEWKYTDRTLVENKSEHTTVVAREWIDIPIEEEE